MFGGSPVSLSGQASTAPDSQLTHGFTGGFPDPEVHRAYPEMPGVISLLCCEDCGHVQQERGEDRSG